MGLSGTWAIVAALLVTAVSAFASLALGADSLDAVLPGGLPVGNVLAALGFCAAACAAVRLCALGTLSRRVSMVLFFAAAAWLPVSVVLAGNLALNFGGWRGTAWLAYSLVVAAGVSCCLLWALLRSLVALCRGAGSAS